MNHTLFNKLESAWGVLIYGELHYVYVDWENEEGEMSFAFVPADNHEGNDYLNIPYSKEETLEVTYNKNTLEWSIANMDIPSFQILKIDEFV